MSCRRVESVVVEFDKLETSVMVLRCLLDYFVTAVLYSKASESRNSQELRQNQALKVAIR